MSKKSQNIQKFEKEESKISLRFPIELKEIIQKIADEEDRSFSAQLIRFAKIGLKEYQNKK